MIKMRKFFIKDIEFSNYKSTINVKKKSKRGGGNG